VADSACIDDAPYMIVVGDAKKTASQVRWICDVGERLQKPKHYLLLRARTGAAAEIWPRGHQIPRGPSSRTP